MKHLIALFLLLSSLSIYAQAQYVIFEEKPLFDTTLVSPFKLRQTHVELLNKTARHRTLNIYNLYYSKYAFDGGGIDKIGFKKALTDYKSFGNDILILITPLTDSLNNKLIKLQSAEIAKLNIIPNDDLLRTAIKNLYAAFTHGEIAGSQNPYTLTSKKYGLIIKKGNDYYKVNATVQTQMFLIDTEQYLFPNQYHDGEINASLPINTAYFNEKKISQLRKEYDNIDKAGKLFKDRIYPAGIDSVAGIYPAIKYISYPLYGIGAFYFYQGLGIINGSFDQYINDVTKANYDIENFKTGIMLYNPVKINSVPIVKALKQIKGRLSHKKILIEL